MGGTDADKRAAKEAIETVLLRYCRSMDRIDAELGYSVWHEGGTADYGPVFNGTGRGFIDWVCEFHRGLDDTSHQIANTLIDVDGNKAVSETYVTVALLGTREGKRMLTTGRGRYLDRWSHRDGRWAIDHRQYCNDFAIVQEVEAFGGNTARNLGDPSYALLGAVGAA